MVRRVRSLRWIRSRRWILAALALSFFAASPAARAEVEVGAEAPDVSAEEYVNTEPLSLVDLSGRLILLELWKTT